MVEMSESEAIKAIAELERLREFMKSEDYRKFIVEGYLKEEPARIALGITNVNMQDEVDQRVLGEMFRAVGHFNNFFMEKIRALGVVKAEYEEYKQSAIEAAQIDDEAITVDPITGDECIVEEA